MIRKSKHITSRFDAKNSIIAFVRSAGLLFLIICIGCTTEMPLRGVITLRFSCDFDPRNPFTEIYLKSVFIKPGGDSVKVNGFYDGNNTFKIRAYCSETGKWRWYTNSNVNCMNGRKGCFSVIPSKNKGKLRINKKDPHQFMFDNGDWYLHIGETGYRYLVDNELWWREYIDQVSITGITKIRCWVARSRHTVESVFNDDRSGLNLAYWQEMEKRLDYALQHHPQIIIQIIPFAEDEQELKSFRKGDPLTRKALEYMQARWSSYPNVIYCISNDMNINGEKELLDAVNMSGDYLYREEPWGTLITNHQKRYQGYSFTQSHWSDIITIQDIDQISGQKVLEYRKRSSCPVVLDEDRYETWRNPMHDRYYFRRLMWANLLSGGHATYGGLRTYEMFSDTLTHSGIMGYYRANHLGLLEDGAHDFFYVHKFFTDKCLDLINWTPSDSLVGNRPELFKCMQKENDFIIYLQNPDDPPDPVHANVSDCVPELKISLPEYDYTVNWYCPRSGLWYDQYSIKGSKQTKLAAPAGKDWIVYISMINHIR